MKNVHAFYFIAFLISAFSLSPVQVSSTPCEDEKEDTRLHGPASKHSLDEVRTLLRAGISPISQDSNRWTPIHIAAQKSDVEMLKVLAEGYKDKSFLLKVRTNLGDTPFHTAAYGGNVEALSYLLSLYEEGVNISGKEGGYEGFSPLHTAASQGHLKAVGLLYSKGAKTDLRDNFGRIPLHLARTYDVVQFLMQRTYPIIEISIPRISYLSQYAAQHEDKYQLRILLNGTNNTIISFRDNKDEAPYRIGVINLMKNKLVIF